MGSKFIVATLVGAVVLFLLGYVLYELLFGGFFESQSTADVMRATPGFLWIILGQVAAAALLAKILVWKGASSVTDGAKAGALFGFLLSLAMGLTNYGVFDMATLTATLVDPLISAVLFGCGGAAIAAMLGRGSAAAA